MSNSDSFVGLFWSSRIGRSTRWLTGRSSGVEHQECRRRSTGRHGQTTITSPARRIPRELPTCGRIWLKSRLVFVRYNRGREQQISANSASHSIEFSDVLWVKLVAQLSYLYPACSWQYSWNVACVKIYNFPTTFTGNGLPLPLTLVLKSLQFHNYCRSRINRMYKTAKISTTNIRYSGLLQRTSVDTENIAALDLPFVICLYTIF